jgi:glycosyltransferase involved in cell wall biosynthesis
MKQLTDIRRVLIVSPKGVGGIQSWAVKFAAELQEKLGVKADVLWEDYGISDRDAGTCPEIPGVATSVFGYESTDNRAHVCRRLEAILFGYDLVYPNTSGMTYQAVAHMGARRPVAIGACRGDFEHDYGTLQRFAFWLDHIFSISSMCAERLCARLPEGSPAVTAIPHAILPGERRQEKDGVFRIAFTGRFDPVKRIPDLLQAAHKLRERGVRFEMILAGDGPLHARIRSDAEAMKISDVVRFTGFIGKQEIEKLVSESHMLALISERESFGLSALEAMAYGAVPVISEGCGCREAIAHEKNGIVIKVGDVESLVRAVVELDGNRERWDELSLAAQRTVEERYHPDQVFAVHRTVIEEALARHNAKAPSAVPSPYLFSRLDQPYLPNAVTRFVRSFGKRKVLQ